MSRGFVKESDQEPAPFIPPRAPLPSGSPNYVTPNGLRLLEEELDALEKDKRELNLPDEDQQRRGLVVLNARMAALNARIAGARVIDPAGQPKEEVRFGAKVIIAGMGDGEQTFQIVGVDEANIKDRKVAFNSPLAKALTGLWEGEAATLPLGAGTRNLQVIKITYQ